MATRSEQIYDELLLEYSDENLLVKIDKDLLENLQTHKAALTRHMKRWVEENAAEWVDEDTIRLIVAEDTDEGETDKGNKIEEDTDKGNTDEGETDKPIDTTNNIEDIISQPGNQDEREMQNGPDESLPFNAQNIIIEMLERRFATKITQEMKSSVLGKLRTNREWQYLLKKIAFDEIPDKVILNYLDYIVGEN